MRKCSVTLSRQFGSGGSEIGRELSQALDIKYVDKSIIATAAQSSGISKELFERSDEKRSNSFLSSLASAHYLGSMSNLPLNEIITDDKLFMHTAEAIKQLATDEPCLIVGRCADDILADLRIVRIYLYANFDDRIKRIARLYDINERAAATLIKKTDKRRANYYNFYTSKTWGEAQNYDICLNTSILRKDGTVDVLKSFVEKFYSFE